MSEFYADFQTESDPIQILTSSSHLDHVYSYFGQSYGQNESKILHELNTLSRKNALMLHKSQSTSRDVRILLPTQIQISVEDNEESTMMPDKKTRFGVNQASTYNSSKSYKSNGMNSSFDMVDENEDDYLILGQSHFYPKPDTSYRQFENKNYQTFLYNFNKIAAGCYLKLFKAPQDLWNLYSLDKHLQEETNFKSNHSDCIIRESQREEKRLSQCLHDKEFVSNYVDLMIKMHNQIVSKLYVVLNSPTVRFHVNQLSQETSLRRKNNMNGKHNRERKYYKSNYFEPATNKSSTENHLFRSFRILGLRQEKDKFKRTSRHYKSSSNYYSRGGGGGRFNSVNSSDYVITSSTQTSSSENNSSDQSYMHLESCNSNSSLGTRFSDVIDIRSAFDVRQFQNRSGYDCFIECEMNYYKINADCSCEDSSRQNRFDFDKIHFNNSMAWNRQSDSGEHMGQMFFNSDFQNKPPQQQYKQRESNCQSNSGCYNHRNEAYKSNNKIESYFVNNDLLSENNMAYKYTDNDLRAISRNGKAMTPKRHIPTRNEYTQSSSGYKMKI